MYEVLNRAGIFVIPTASGICLESVRDGTTLEVNTRKQIDSIEESADNAQIENAQLKVTGQDLKFLRSLKISVEDLDIIKTVDTPEEVLHWVQDSRIRNGAQSASVL